MGRVESACGSAAVDPLDLCVSVYCDVQAFSDKVQRDRGVRRYDPRSIGERHTGKRALRLTDEIIETRRAAGVRNRRRAVVGCDPDGWQPTSLRLATGDQER